MLKKHPCKRFPSEILEMKDCGDHSIITCKTGKYKLYLDFCGKMRYRKIIEKLSNQNQVRILI